MYSKQLLLGKIHALYFAALIWYMEQVCSERIEGYYPSHGSRYADILYTVAKKAFKLWGQDEV